VLSQTVGLERHAMMVDDEAIYESIVFLDYFLDLPDPRQLIKVIYPLDEVLLLSLLAALAGAKTFTDIARSARRSSVCCVGSVRFSTRRDSRPAGRDLRRSMPSGFRNASWRGWRPIRVSWRR